MRNKLLFIRNKTAASTRNESLDGKEYLVIPCVMIVEGVHNGSQGALYYSQEELAKFTCCWNMKPVLLRHPDSMDSGTDLSILKNQGVGILLNTEFEDGKLKTEIWLDENKANNLDSRIVERINNDEMIEVSTGLFTELDKVPGTWNSEGYSSNTLNYRPDHLAILLDEKGACSIEDGAGLLRNKEYSVDNENSHSEIHCKLMDAIRESITFKKDEWAWVESVYSKYFIYEKGNQYFKQDYTIDSNDNVSLVGEAEEVKRKVEFKPVIKNKNNEEIMLKPEMIAALIANKKFASVGKDVLESMSEAQLSALIANAKKMDKEDEEDEDKKKKDKKTNNAEGSTPVATSVANATPALVAPVAPVAPTVESFLASAPDSIKAVINQSLSVYNAAKLKAIETITANKLNKFTAEVLNTKSVEELEMIASLCPAVTTQTETPTENSDTLPVLEPVSTAALYAPQSTTTVVENAGDTLPTLNVQEMFPKEK